MRSIIAIALGLMLLVSAAAAGGNNNIATVTATETMAGQVITNANFAQMADADANLLGNMNVGFQVMTLTATTNILTGAQPDGKTFFCQSVDQMLNETGNSNTVLDTQLATLTATANILTNSAASQIVCQNEDIIGNNNAAVQTATEIMTSDILTNAGALQKINEDVRSLGNTNTITQTETLTSTANTVTGGIISQISDVLTRT